MPTLCRMPMRAGRRRAAAFVLTLLAGLAVPVWPGAAPGIAVPTPRPARPAEAPASPAVTPEPDAGAAGGEVPAAGPDVPDAATGSGTPSTPPSGQGTSQAQAEPAPAAIMFGGRLEADAESAALTLILDRRIEIDHFVIAEPDRVVLDTPALVFNLSPGALQAGDGLVRAVRYGAVGPGRSRIVLTLGGPARIEALDWREDPAFPDRHELTVRLRPVTADAFAAEAARGRSQADQAIGAADTRAAQPKREGRFTIVVDPGHGGIDGGAHGEGGVLEKDITLAMGRELKAAITAAGPFDVLLTRDDDRFVSLDERVAFARRHTADLVISLHADSVRQAYVRGASIYTLSRSASDALARELAESEQFADIAAGLEAGAADDILNDILADLMSRETAVFSRSFSNHLVDAMSGRTSLLRLPQRSASFKVLKAPEIPGVLLELGYLSNAEDEKQLVDPAWRTRVAGLIAEAVKRFFTLRMR